MEREDGSWLDVPRKNSLIVNIGASLSKMTNNCLKATIHRVLAIGRPRRSAPFFFETSFHAFLPKSLPQDNSMKSAADCNKDDCFEYGTFLVESIRRFVRMSVLCSNFLSIIIVDNRSKFVCSLYIFALSDMDLHGKIIV